MKINIKATNIELTPEVSAYVEKKISSVEKYIQAASEAVAQVEVGKSTNHHKTGDIFRAEVHIIGAGLDLYAVYEQADLYAAIDFVKDEIIENALHQKERKQTLTRRGAQMMKNMLKGFKIFRKRK